MSAEALQVIATAVGEDVQLDTTLDRWDSLTVLLIVTELGAQFPEVVEIDASFDTPLQNVADLLKAVGL